MASDLIEFLENAELWVIDHQIVVGVVIALIGVLKIDSIVGFFAGRGKNAPRIEFELERVDPISGHENLTFVLKVVNVEGRVASDVRCIWTRRSSCTMTPVPQPFMLMFDEPRRFEFAVNMADLVLRATRTKGQQRLGWLELDYSTGSGRRKRVGRAMVVGDADVPVDLAPIPPKPLEEIIPLLGRWKEKRLRDRDIRNFNQWLQDSRAYLEEHSIPVHLITAQETFHRLLGELSSRGWRWDYGPGGRGYEIRAEKHWEPSSSMTIRFSAETPVDVVTLVLANAIKEDEQRGR